jgi:hypothetical protein
MRFFIIDVVGSIFRGCRVRICVEMTSNHAELLSRLYFSENAESGAFAATTALYRAAKNIDATVTLKNVRDFLNSTPSWLLTSNVPNRDTIPKNTVLEPSNIFAKDQTWFMDTAFLNPSFGNMRYLIVCIDYLTKFAHVQCFRQLSAKNALIALQNFLRDSVGKPLSIVTDFGGEFKGVFSSFLNETGIKHVQFILRNKSYLSERLIRDDSHII